MDWAISSNEGVLFLLRWGHFIFGIAWIGVLWYFNFIQGPFFAETSPEVKTAATQKLVPRALWWFRWGAMGTFLTGWAIIAMRFAQAGDQGAALMNSSWGLTIMTGSLFGSLMWFNVWFIIWPRQKKVIASANGEKIENLPAVARRAFLASRTNTLLSIPLLFFMGAASHLVVPVNPANVGIWMTVVLAVLILAEVNALMADKGPTKPIEKVKGVITTGLILTAILYVLLEVIV